MNNQLKKVGIFCSGKTDMKQEYISIVSSILQKIDTEKIALVYGGGHVGLMGVIRDVYKGKIISSNLTKFVNNNSETIEDDFVFEKISDRQSKLIDLSDMFIVFPGGFGTMYECLEVITKNQIGEHFKKIIIFNYNGLYNNTYTIPIYSTGYTVALTIFGILGIVLLIITAFAVIPDGNISYKYGKKNNYI